MFLSRGGGWKRGFWVACNGFVVAGGREYGSGTVPRGKNLSHSEDGTLLSEESGEPLLHVVFFRPQIHWNTGNIGRTCIGIGGAKLHLIGKELPHARDGCCPTLCLLNRPGGSCGRLCQDQLLSVWMISRCGELVWTTGQQ